MTQHHTQTRHLLLLPVLVALCACTGRLGAQSMEVLITHTAIACNGGTSTASVTVIGNAQPPFTYSWSNGLTTQNVNLPAGTYSVTVQDNQGQSAADTVVITEPAALGVAIVTEQQICAIAPDGAATAVPFGGTPPYSFLWSNGGNTAQITGLAAGIYVATVTDANNCTTSGEGEVEYWDEGLWLMITPTEVLCHGDSTGSIKVTPMSGTPPYTYIWNTGDTTQIVFNLPAGNYSVTVTDVNGCENSMDGEIQEPAPLTLVLNAIGGSSCDSLTCAYALPGGGVGPYTLLWDTGSDNDTICGLNPGFYTVTATDANNCTVVDSIQIIITDTLNITIDITGCAGCTVGGSVVATVGSGSGSYTFQWDNGDTTATADSLSAGPHTVIVTDLINGCVDTATVDVPVCPPIVVDVQTDSLATCLEGGQASANGSGGVPPYTIQWDNGETGATADSLLSGVHTVTVTDATGCVAVDTFVMGVVPGPTVNIQVTGCAGCLIGGSALASVTVGSGSYTYLWDNGDTTISADSLSAGPHTLIVTDLGTGCKDTSSVNIPTCPPLVVDVQIDSLATCLEGGQATATPSGGVAPYTIQWDNGETGATADSLLSGVHTVSVTDATGCAAVDTFVMGVVPGPTVNIQVTGCAGCLIGGSALASVTVGSGSYTYLWDNGDTTISADSLSAGPHTLIVTDLGTGCKDTSSVNIPTCPPLVVDVQIDSLATCLEGGQATATPSGGAAPYTIQWDNGETGATADSLLSGVHTVSVTDATGCVAVDTFVMGVVPGPTVNIQVTGCAGCVIGGSAVANVTVGSGNYTYLWDNGDTTISADSLSAGPHTLIVTDLGTGCKDTSSVNIPTCPPLVVDVQIDSLATCLEGGQATATPSGGAAPYTIQWDNGETGATADSLLSGVHTVSVTDATGCVAVDTFVMGVVPSPTVNIQVTGCAGCVIGGSAVANVTVGSGNYTYLWDNGDTTISADSLSAGPHTLIVTDLGTGCKDTADVNIPVCPPLNVNIQIDSLATCLTGGTATANVSGGQAPYIIQWDNGQTGLTAVGLSTGFHTVTITDATGCVFIAGFTMGQTPNPDVSATVLSHAVCGLGGSAQAFPSGGLPPYVFFWDNGDTTAVADSLSPGVHCVTVTDSNGCADTACVTINPPPTAPTIAISIVVPATCLLGATLEVTVVSGGVPPYSFLWSTGDTTAVVDSLPGGIHCVTVTDSLGCSSVACDTLQVPTLPDPVATIVTPAGCLTGATANVSATGGFPPYTYLWMPGNYMSGNVSNLPPGNYTITVTDTNGCSGTTTLNVTAPQQPVISVVSTSKQTCNMFATASVTTAGGTPPYSYQWENGEMGPMADSLIAGNHFVIVTDAAGCMDTASVSVSFTPNGIAIGDFVWYDDDQDGFQDSQETDGVNNIIVRLTQAGSDGIFGTSDDVTVKTDTTGPDGMYFFDCVVPGDYVLIFSGLPFSFQWAGKNQSNDDCKDSDVNSNGRTDPFTVTQTLDDNLCLDAGIHMMCQNVINAGLICCNQTICEGETPAALTQVQPPVGGQGPLEFLWLTLDQSGPGQPIWVGIPGANGPNYQPGPLTETSYFMRCARRAGCIQFLESNVVTITVLPAGSPGCGSFLKDFTVEALGNFDVKIYWRTLPELVQFVYTVEHSPDLFQWRPVTTIIGKYNPQSESSYTTIHHTPVRGLNYYRIKRVDPFGLVSYSEIRSINLDLSFKDAVLIYPNPVSDVLTIQNLAAFESETTVELIAPNGAIVQTYVIPKSAVTIREIPVDNLASGLYFVRIRFENGERRTVKISKF